MKILKLLGLFCLCIAFHSCVDEEIDGGDIPEGQPALVNLQLTVAPMGNGNPSTKGVTNEKTIKTAHVLIFDASGKKRTDKMFTGYNGSDLSVPTYSGANQTLCVVANASDEVNTALSNSTTLNEAKEVLDKNTFGLLNDSKSTTSLVMSYMEKQNITITNTVSVNLTYIAAKLKMTVKNTIKPEIGTLTLDGWKVVDSPTTSYVLKQDNANPMSGSFETGTDQKVVFDSAIEMYLLENLRGGRRANAREDVELAPGKKPNDSYYQGQQGKRLFAPDKATYILISGKYKAIKESATHQFRAYIYIGANNTDDYNITRGLLYNYTVTINGLNDINVDSNIEQTVASFKVDFPASGLTEMDTHPDFRAIRVTAPKGRLTMEILDQSGGEAPGNELEDGNFPAKWLKVSLLNLMQPVTGVAESDNYNEPGFWQERGAGTFARTRYLPHKAKRVSMVLEKKWWNVKESGNWFTAKDNVISCTDGKSFYAHRMCYKITDIPFPDASTRAYGVPTPRTFYVYADEYLKNEGSRSAKIRFSFYRDGNMDDANPDVIREYPIQQCGYKSIFKEKAGGGLALLDINGSPTGGKKEFFVEQKEESAMEVDFTRFTAEGTMQWGFAKETLYGKTTDGAGAEAKDRTRNGEFLTANAIYENLDQNSDHIILKDYYSTGKYRKVYGREGEGITSDYHPIYNTSAARYCHEKNRDENGDGKIDYEEAKWYLPALDQLLLLWIADKGKDAWGFESFLAHLTSSEVDWRQDAKGDLWDKQAVGTIYITGSIGSTPLYVRCIRNN